MSPACLLRFPRGWARTGFVVDKAMLVASRGRTGVVPAYKALSPKISVSYLLAFLAAALLGTYLGSFSPQRPFAYLLFATLWYTQYVIVLRIVQVPTKLYP